MLILVTRVSIVERYLHREDTYGRTICNYLESYSDFVRAII